MAEPSLINALKSGHILTGCKHSLAVEEFTHLSPTWVCGSDFILERLIGIIPDSLLSILDATDGKITLQIDIKNASPITCIVDYEGAIGKLSMKLNQPVGLMANTELKNPIPKFARELNVPLPPEIENAIQQLKSACTHQFCYNLDGSFELKKTT